MELNRTLVESIINILDEIVECSKKHYKYPFSIKRTKEIADNLVSLLEEGE